MDMCPLHNNYIGENTSCPTCLAEARLMAERIVGQAFIPVAVQKLLDNKDHMIADLVDEMRVRGYYYKIMKWTAAAGWVCVVLLLAYGHKL